MPLDKDAETSYPNGWMFQFTVLFLRSFMYKLREPAAVMTQASTSIVIPLVAGGVFWKISLAQNALYDRLSAVSFLIIMQSFMCYDQVLLICKERAVYLKDNGAGIYRTSAFYISRICAELPFVLGFAWLAATIAYWMYGFQASGEHYLTFCVIICAVTEAGAAVLNSVGALAKSMETANIYATLLLLILVLFDGFYVNLQNLPPWCRWIHVFSFQGYAVQAAAANEFRGRALTCTEAEIEAAGCMRTGEDFLLRLGFDRVNVWANVGYLVIFSSGNRFLSYMSLRFLHTGQSIRERWNNS